MKKNPGDIIADTSQGVDIWTLTNTHFTMDDEIFLDEELQPFYSLWVAVVRSAVKEKDYTYFCSDTFLMHCTLICMDPSDILNRLPAGLKKKVFDYKDRLKGIIR